MTDPVREGAISVVFINAAGTPVLTTELQELADGADEFLARYLVEMIREVATPRAVIAISRMSGRATVADRLLWSLIEPLCDGGGVWIDVVVVGTTKSWSLRSAAAA